MQAEWTRRQLLEAFPWDSSSRYLLRDRDGMCGEKFHETTEWLGIREVLAAPQFPWQNHYVEWLIGSVRRDRLDHVMVLNETCLRSILKSYFKCYERALEYHPPTEFKLAVRAYQAAAARPLATAMANQDLV
jgi:hypothetical protein